MVQRDVWHPLEWSHKSCINTTHTNGITDSAANPQQKQNLLAILNGSGCTCAKRNSANVSRRRSFISPSISRISCLSVRFPASVVWIVCPPSALFWTVSTTFFWNGTKIGGHPTWWQSYKMSCKWYKKTILTRKICNKSWTIFAPPSCPPPSSPMSSCKTQSPACSPPQGCCIAQLLFWKSTQ